MNLSPNDFHPVIAALFSPTWTITDATKLKTYMDCPRKYFYNYVLGWSKEGSNIHFVFGSAIHLALEHLLQIRSDNGTISLETDFPKAIEIFMKEYRTEIPSSDDDSYHPKSPAGATMLLREYIAKYNALDDFKVLYREVAGCAPIDEEDFIHFKMDAIIEIESGENSGLWALEHKTAGRLTKPWQMGWQTDIQPGTYIHALNCCFPDKHVQGCMINGLIIRKKDCEFIRIPVKKTYEQLMQWLYNRRFNITQIAQNFELLKTETPKANLMTAFPMNETACTKYGLCPYHAFCTASTFTNPVANLHRKVPLGFIVKHWDPRKKEETAKAVIKGDTITEREANVSDN